MWTFWHSHLETKAESAAGARNKNSARIIFLALYLEQTQSQSPLNVCSQQKWVSNCQHQALSVIKNGWCQRMKFCEQQQSQDVAT
jgi:hypothetical protein